MKGIEQGRGGSRGVFRGGAIRAKPPRNSEIY